ncbi:hypothetical protein [Streptomyces asiaticus]|uniref:hypothetical protein n=1 Tax=Streptomyces asiaticus TaxID=114695 RepID=UPI003827CC74
MTTSPTSAERAALKVAQAATMTPDASYDMTSAIVFALGSAQLLQSPETAAELEQLRARVDEVERKYTFDTAALKKRAAEARAERADQHDDLAHALGRSIGTEWSDLISIAASAVEAEETARKLRARVAELEAEQGKTGGAKAPWGRAEDGRPYLPEGAHWTDVPELVDRTVAGIQARVDQAQPGHWYTAPATETGLAPGTVRTRVNGCPLTVGQFTNVLPADLELVLHAHGDLSWCLAMLAKFRARVAELEAEVEPEPPCTVTASALAPGLASEESVEAARAAFAAAEAGAPSQVLPLAVDVPVPVVLTEMDGPAVVTSAALAATEKLRRGLPLELPGGERS